MTCVLRIPPHPSVVRFEEQQEHLQFSILIGHCDYSERLPQYQKCDGLQPTLVQSRLDIRGGW